MTQRAEGPSHLLCLCDGGHQPKYQFLGVLDGHYVCSCKGNTHPLAYFSSFMSSNRQLEHDSPQAGSKASCKSVSCVTRLYLKKQSPSMCPITPTASRECDVMRCTLISRLMAGQLPPSRMADGHARSIPTPSHSIRRVEWGKCLSGSSPCLSSVVGFSKCCKRH